MTEIKAKTWLPAMQQDWQDPEARRARIQDVLLVGTLGLVQPDEAAEYEAHVLGNNSEIQSRKRLELLKDILRVVNGQRLSIPIGDFETTELLQMGKLDATETMLMGQPSPEAVIAEATRFIRRLHVQNAA